MTVMTQKNVRKNCSYLNSVQVPQNRKLLRTYLNFVVSCSSIRWWLYLVLSLLLLSSSVNSLFKVIDTSSSSILKWLTVLLVEFSYSVSSYTYMKEFHTLSNLLRCHNNFFLKLKNTQHYHVTVALDTALTSLHILSHLKK